VAALTEMYIQGVSTRKVKAISEELCGHSFSASAISGFNKKLDEELGRFSRRQLDCEYPYLILDARYEKMRENAVIRSRAVLVAIGIDWEGRRQVLGVEMANRESSTSWKEFLLGLKRRGLRGVIFAVSDDHPGLKRAIIEVLPEAYWQRCYVHFLRNALDYLPRKIADDCLVELRWLYDRRNAEEARRDLDANNANNFNSWRPPNVNATTYSQTGCSGLSASAAAVPYRAPAAATSPCRSVCE
jgi:putative transposase